MAVFTLQNNILPNSVFTEAFETEFDNTLREYFVKREDPDFQMYLCVFGNNILNIGVSHFHM